MAIAVDAMGGDTPIAVKVKAAVEAVNDFDIEVVARFCPAQWYSHYAKFTIRAY